MDKIIISSDSHVFEPTDLWKNTLGSRFGDNLPQGVSNFEGHEGNFFYVGRPGEAARLEELVSDDGKDRRLDDLAKAGSDPVYRLELMDKDGIYAEVLNPTWGLWIPRMADGAARNACAEVFNDWIQEYCSQNLKRLLAVAMIPIVDVDWAVKELDRVVKRGARAIMIGTNPVDGAAPYRDRKYDKFWAAAQEAELPVTLHIVTGRVRDPFTYHGDKERENIPASFLDLFYEVQPALANEFIFGGIFDRFPRLKIFLSEYDASWLPILKYRLNRVQTFPGFDHLEKKPASRYVEENIYAGIINDPLAAKLRNEIGIDRIMWGSDFPHPPCPYPNTTQNIDRILNELSPEDRFKVVAGNAAKLFKIDL
ncbi:putative metal-dependent hydrolase of the TIM-barrel fold protein [Variovorax sp. PBS-H4]|uniref:amidohydrolase family protein n=1 Tax=Variovorax sp. PBS-H4 TaxID=434008 RepID=UPI001318CA9D|nr:amidohydrolase family protein [Variovorax sp. PBS-H4]VTU18198.1 putative metal-dependent hydrolase of the TIM-barrel fold protein [Variovorax sp. PBS-H4]